MLLLSEVAGSDLLTLIGNYAFPIVACVALFWKLIKDQERHQKEIDALRQSLDNNTKVLTELSAVLTKETK